MSILLSILAGWLIARTTMTLFFGQPGPNSWEYVVIIGVALVVGVGHFMWGRYKARRNRRAYEAQVAASLANLKPIFKPPLPPLDPRTAIDDPEYMRLQQERREQRKG